VASNYLALEGSDGDVRR